MQEVYPVSHRTVYPYIGRRVSAVTYDGKHIIGTIKGVKDGQLILEDCTFDKMSVTVSSVRKGKQSRKQTRSKHKARLSSYYDGYGGGYDGYGGGYGGHGGGCGCGCGGSFFFPFAIFASLFILPFFFI
ncbi:hypothetical protein M3194_02145 [Paenibacillus glycanilyticus]|uniref:hypothetical protein n=1 Tax=Paenibacillus glycanilyticus TaxID=126569 RepID=UPI00203DAA2B|nr:hypothetical protein [Paenibacillus glycanilyticus]MCM3626167.1 hypothetical protein [Paenibacillus glycanilyticus]